MRYGSQLKITLSSKLIIIIFYSCHGVRLFVDQVRASSLDALWSPGRHGKLPRNERRLLPDFVENIGRDFKVTPSSDQPSQGSRNFRSNLLTSSGCSS